MTPPATGWWWRLVRPRHTIWPTRDGWWYLFAAIGLGLAAVNTGNNLVYLLCSMLLALIVVSGLLSEQSMRGLRVTALLPEEIYAGRPALFGAVIANEKRWLASHSITIEVLGSGGGRRFQYLPRLGAGAEGLCTWEATLPARGRQRLAGIRLTTRFPFGLFLKAGRPILDPEVLVYPAVGPVPAHLRSQLGGAGESAARRRGRGHDLYDLRQYRSGDDPRLIHWRSSAKTQSLVVRELEEETALDTRIVLEGTGARDVGRLERGLSDAASLATHLIRAGAAVELVGPGVLVSLGRGRGQERHILTVLALYEPAGSTPADVAARVFGPARGHAREIRVGLD